MLAGFGAAELVAGLIAPGASPVLVVGALLIDLAPAPVKDFVIGLFDNAGVAQQGNIFDARKLLVAGERRGERELAGQPLAHAELLGVIARLRIGLGDYQEALQLLERQDALLTQLSASTMSEVQQKPKLLFSTLTEISFTPGAPPRGACSPCEAMMPAMCVP